MRAGTKQATGAAPTTRLVATLAFSALALSALALAACAPGGGGGSSGGAQTFAGVAGAATTAATETHWQVALAALGSSSAPLALELTQAAVDPWNQNLAESWPEVADQLVHPRLEAALRAQIASLVPQGSAVTLKRLRNLSIDIAAAPGVRTVPTSLGQNLAFELPLAPRTWAISFTVDAEIRIATRLFGQTVQTVLALDLDVDASDVRVQAGALLDLSDPLLPRVIQAGLPNATLTLRLGSGSPILNQVASTLNQVLDPLIRAAIVAGSVFGQQQILVALGQVPTQVFGTGLAPAQGIGQPVSLERVANEISDVIQRDHMPWGTLLSTIYDQPGFGNGNVVGYFDHGDSAGWTNHYLMGEALRFDLTGDARALAGATWAVEGTRRCLEVSAPGDGQLSRCAVPMSDPLVSQIAGNADFFVGTVDGRPFGAIGDMSRDHYTLSLLGEMQAYLRVPALRAQTAQNVTRMLDYLVREHWNIKRPGTRLISRGAPFAQSSSAVLAFVRSGYVIDSQRYGALHDRYKPMSQFLWLPNWLSSLGVHEQYYKFNLEHDALTTLFTTETDPDRYRDYMRALQVVRRQVAHHDNAWFDTVWGLAVPAAAPAMGTRVQNALERWTLRDRRTFAPNLLQDPTIPKVLYQSALYPQPWMVAVQPVPIERRPPNDFLWQKSPFGLTGHYSQPTRQYPGVDLLQPYWTARAYGMVR